MKYFIVGNNQKGVYAAEEIRKKDSEAEISILLPSEDYPIDESRVFDFLRDSIKINTILLKKKSFYSKRNINLLFNSKIKSFDFSNKVIFIEDGTSHKYDVLVLAFDPSNFLEYNKFSGKTITSVFNTINRIEKLKKNLVPLDRVGIFGDDIFDASLAINLSLMGLKPSLFLNKEEIFGGLLDKEQTVAVLEVLENKDVEVIMNENIRKIEDNVVFLSLKEKEIQKEYESFFRYIENDFEKDDKSILNQLNKSVFLIDYFECTQKDETQKMVSSIIDSIFSDKSEKKHLKIPTIINKDIEIALAGEYKVKNDLNYDIITMNPTGEYKKIVLKDNQLIGFAFIGDVKKAISMKEHIDNQTKLTDSQVRELFV